MASDDHGAARGGRRLSERVCAIFHAACDQQELEAAELLLRALELLVTRRRPPVDAAGRRELEALVAAHERLWLLRHGQSVAPS